MTKSILALAAMCLGLGVTAPQIADAGPRNRNGHNARSSATHTSPSRAVRSRRSTPRRAVTPRTQRAPRYRAPARTHNPRYRAPARHRRIWRSGRYLTVPVFTAQSPARVVITNNRGYGIQVRVRTGASTQCAYNPVTATRWLGPGQSMAVHTYSDYVCARSLGGGSPYDVGSAWQIQAVVAYAQNLWL